MGWTGLAIDFDEHGLGSPFGYHGLVCAGHVLCWTWTVLCWLFSGGPWAVLATAVLVMNVAGRGLFMGYAGHGFQWARAQLDISRSVHRL
jgi:hypothetical protein